MHGRWKTARVLLVEADEIYLPALQQYVAATCEKHWGSNWYEEWAGRILDYPKLDQFKRVMFEDKIEEVRRGMEQPHQQLEHYDFAKTVGKGVHAALFPKRWTGKNNEKRVKNAKKTMDELSRHRTHWATFEEVVSRIIPAWIRVLELLPDVRPAKELRELGEEARTGLSPEQLQLMEQAAELGHTRALAFRQLSDETESAWFERMHGLNTATMPDAAARLSTDDHSAFEAEVERQLKHYAEMLPVADDVETIKRREECRTQLSLELNEAEKEGLTWRQLYAWRQHRVLREQYGVDLETWDEYVLQVLEASDAGLTDEQLEAWRLHQLSRERSGLDWETLESVQRETRAAERLKLSVSHLQVWWRNQLSREHEGLSAGDLDADGILISSAMQRKMTASQFGLILGEQVHRDLVGLEPPKLERLRVEMRSWERWQLPEQFLELWWAVQLSREALGEGRQPLTDAENAARQAKREGWSVAELQQKWLESLTGSSMVRVADFSEANLERWTAQALAQGATRKGLTPMQIRLWAANSVRREGMGLDPMDLELAATEAREAHKLSMHLVELSSWWESQTARDRLRLPLRSLSEAASEVRASREVGMTAAELGVWWGACSLWEKRDQQQRSLSEAATEAQAAREAGMTVEELAYWWEDQSLREKRDQQQRSLSEAAKEAQAAREAGMTVEELDDYWATVAYREWRDLPPRGNLSVAAAEISEARSLGMDSNELQSWWFAVAYREWRRLPLMSLEKAGSDARRSRELGVSRQALGAWWFAEAYREWRELPSIDLEADESEPMQFRTLGIDTEAVIAWCDDQWDRQIEGLELIDLATWWAAKQDEATA